jgi:hypothetical protein
VREKKSNGWQKTEDGWLPLTEIKKAGFIYNEELDRWMIPCEEYIADGNYDRKAGEKYWGISRKYLNWKTAKQNTNSNRVSIPTTNQINFKKEEEEIPPVFRATNEIKVDEIPF